ncbi:EF-P lysine aminoacylase GenX [Gammaproteobacteria bacterium 42_54_T18]|nr:EF-P lysine aminoacylase GenX [Gammaproteobacteria bacterium 42_54_T18]
MWQPTASIDAIRARADMYAQIRTFFSHAKVLEVETPLLCSTTAMDPYLDSFSLSCGHFLQTSPEFPMKRLLASGSGPIYQISKAFRQDEESSRHNPEFTLLEWYQPGYSLLQLQEELLALLFLLAKGATAVSWGRDSVTCRTYADLFESSIGLCPHTCTVEALVEVAKQETGFEGELTRDSWLDLLMSHVVEPKMPPGLLVLTDFPVGQAALAEIAADEHGCDVAKRLELYIDGVEVANGYQELTDGAEQKRRFEADNEQRLVNGVTQLPIPAHLVSALCAGMPATSGIAVGLDRLLMKLMGKQQLSDVICFPWGRA